jgi:hypothetical protein
VQAILKKPSFVELSAFNKRKSFLPPQSLAFPLKWHPHMASVTVKTPNRTVKTCQKMMNCINKNIGVPFDMTSLKLQAKIRQFTPVHKNLALAGMTGGAKTVKS